jgi:sterol desaturase/sphingolipid hydroxylase (fatty acid hydroxylase superfamily)
MEYATAPFAEIVYYASLSMLRYIAIFLIILLPIEYFIPHTKINFTFKDELSAWTYFFVIFSVMGILAYEIYDVIKLVAPQTPLNYIREYFVPIVGAWPVWVQLAVMFILFELGNYWMHRLSHQWSWLWYFHQIHHSADNVRALTTYRLHVVEKLGQALYHFMIFYLLGFSILPGLILGSFFKAFAITTHVNIRYRIKWLEPLVCMPYYHLRHHDVRVAHKVNFAYFFPVMDKIFGTCDLSNYDWPKKTVMSNSTLGDTFFSQLIYPFRRIARDVVSFFKKQKTSSLD